MLSSPENVPLALSGLSHGSTQHTDDHHYRLMFEAAGVGMARVGLDGRLQEVNPRYAEIVGRQRATLVGMPYAHFIHADDLAMCKALMESTLAGQRERFNLEKRILRPDGETMWIHVAVSLVRDEHNQALHFVSVTEDISERRRFQEAMTSASAAERASKAKTEFLSRMSHELRTPLNAMLGFAQLLRVDARYPLSEAQRQKVAHIERAGAHLLAMLTDVLDLSRIEAGSLPLTLEPQSAVQALDEAVALVSTQAANGQINLQPTPPDPLLYLSADQVRLRQILVNLLSNALKYNQPGGRVTIEATAVGQHAVFTVSDTGLGMTEVQLAHLYEPFNRLGAERTSVEGTGIGLVIVKRLVDLMNGRLDVSSVVGQGSSFRVWLPLAPAPDAEALEAERLRGPRSNFGALDGAFNTTLTVLYAEDNLVNVELVRQVMRMRPQWQLEVAYSGQQAIDMASSKPPDLLLLDMHLGDMTGLEVSDALAHEPGTADIPRVALSADVMPDQIREARERGFLDYLSKPLDLKRLLKLLDQCARGGADA